MEFTEVALRWLYCWVAANKVQSQPWQGGWKMEYKSFHFILC